MPNCQHLFPTHHGITIVDLFGDLTLKAPITTAAGDSHEYFVIVFQRKEDLIFHVNPLLGRGFT